MSKKAVMMYGYDHDAAETVMDVLSFIFGGGIEFISASGMEGSTVLEVLDGGGSGSYEEKNEKILMLIGFGPEEIDAVLKGYPPAAGRRPLFCTPTEENLKWTVAHLMDHLLKERAYWSGRVTKPGG